MTANGPGIYAVLPKAQLSAVAEARKGNIDIYGVLWPVFFNYSLKYNMKWKN